MEIKKVNTLFVDSSSERQPRHSPPVPEQGNFRNQLRDTADSFEALLSKTRLSATSDVNRRLYMAQMQAQKSVLLDEYASTLARLSHDFSRQLGDSGVHLSEVIDSAENTAALSQLLSPLSPEARQRAEQFIQNHQVQIHSLKLKNSEIQNFPGTLERWMEQQRISTTPVNAVVTANPAHVSDDASRYQQISEGYQQHIDQIRRQYSSAANALLMEAQRSMPAVNISLAELMQQIDQPAATATGTDPLPASPLQQWLSTQQPLVDELQQSRDRQQKLPSMADWARQQGISHPWLHS